MTWLYYVPPKSISVYKLYCHLTLINGKNSHKWWEKSISTLPFIFVWYALENHFCPFKATSEAEREQETSSVQPPIYFISILTQAADL